MAESACRMIELDDVSEADRIESDEYIFDKIGASVSLAPGDSPFDPYALPSQPLVVSERLQLLFVAHSDGFLVARTKDVIDSAKEVKEKGSGPSLKELCVVDVLIGKVNIVALSRDSETVAASVGGDIHFFLVNSLLNKDQTPHYSCSLGESEYVKDMKWTIRTGKSYIVLSNNGKLYHGVVGGHLQHVLDNVDAVEWSVNQSLIALARKNVLSILSHDFKETFSMSLCFDSWTDSANDDYTMKVDSIRWDRPDCIILGCFQVTSDGTEEDYLVHAISVKRGRFLTDTLSEPILSSFSELFTGIIDDIVPFGTGPYLFLSYVKQCELGIVANKKSTDRHINLIGWSNGDLNSEVAIIDLKLDKWAPRVPLQDNGDDNLVVGLCVDKASLSEKIRFQRGVDDPKELSPFCVIFCLTLEGKVIMFHLASVSDTSTVHQGTLFSDEDTTTGTSDVRHDNLKVDSETEQPRLKGAVLGFQSNKGNAFGLTEAKSLGAETHEPAMQHIRPLLEQNQVTPTKFANMSLPKTEWDKSLGTLSRGDQGIKGGLKLISSNNMGAQPSNAASESSFYDSYSLISNADFKKGADSGSTAVGKSGISFTNNCPKDPGGGSPFSFPSNNQIHKDATNDPTTDCRDIKGDSVLQHSSFKDASTSTSTLQPTSKIVSSGGPQVSPKIEALPSVRASQKLFQQQTMPDTRFQSEVGKYGARPLSGKLTSEASISKGSINIKDMTEQLDRLLKGIEETGGFLDSTAGQTNSAEALRHGLEALSGECKTWKGIMKERLEVVQDLLNKTVQVIARKTYTESIVKQSSDTQYWDLWDRQRLGSELEMKRRKIIKMHQEMTNQLIQLEMHFNNLELNKFGEKGGANVSQRGFQSRLREPRHAQSLNSLQNTMNSQLVVAEQLSRCLSEQLALLNIDSPCPKQQTVKRDLFKTIGLPLDAASSDSPGYTVQEKHSVPSSSACVKNQSRRNKATGFKNPEPETARRRRESLDRSRVVFEPPKTTVKRTMLRESMNAEIEKSLSISRMLEGSASSLQKERRTSSALYSSQSRALQDNLTDEDSKSSTPMFKWVNNDEGKWQTEGTVSPARTSLHPSYPSISSVPLFGEISTEAPGKVISERAVVRGRSGNGLSDTKSSPPADTKDGRMNLDTLNNTSSLISALHAKEKSLDRPTTLENSTMSGKRSGTQSAPVFVAPKVPVLGGKTLDFGGGSSQSQPGIGVFSPALTASSSATSLFSSVSSLSAASSVFPLSSDRKSSSVSDAFLSKPSSSQVEQPFTTTNGSVSMEKTEVSGNAGAQEDEMEEEAPETSLAAELTLGRPDGFGLGSTSAQAAAAPKINPFGGSLGSVSAIPAGSPFSLSSSGGELFRPASFSFSPPQSQPTPSQPATNSFFGGFGSATKPVGFQPEANQAPSVGGFGQPAQVGQGQQALGSVLGSFGQSRQIGIGQPANSFAPASGFGSGFTGSQSAGGFANAASKPGGFAALASNSGGFAGAAASSGGFAGAAAPAAGAGFGGFAGAAAPTAGAGFGGFAGAAGGGGFGQQGSSFSAFGGTGAQPPSQLFTQMRK
uniref:Nuclear pore complex protein NUP214 n=1 Tax=Kalanchoe fedtschenkoi TaxID=63787 RepID=A0A7N0THU9_KALFE